MHKLLYCFLLGVFGLNVSNAQTVQDYLEKAISFTHVNIDSGLFYLHQVEQLADSNQHKIELEQTYMYLSRIYRFRNRLDKSLHYAELFYQNSTTSKIKADALLHLAQEYEHIDLEKSDSLLKIVEQMIPSLRDSSFYRFLCANYASMFKLNRQEQKNTIDSLNAENQLQANRLREQEKVIRGTWADFVILFGFLFFIFRSRRKVNQQNKIITKAIKEKDILLREIHHRVKNNFQLVSSLLELQSNYVESPKALEALSSGKSRVRSMSLIHQDLYNREELTGVSVREYLSKLSRELLASYKAENKNVEIKMEVADLVLDVDTLIPLGLIINELLTNAFKYAFPNMQKGIIKIKLFEKDQNLMLEISDDGIGIDNSKVSKSSFGYKLIDTLVDQLEGEMRLQSDNGTQLYLKFKEYKKAA